MIIIMSHTLDQPITVLFYSDSCHRVFPHSLVWRHQTHKITRVGLHHTTRIGQTLYHIFSVTAGQLFFRLKFNTDNLFWILEEVADALPN